MARPFLLSLEPERAHRATIGALKLMPPLSGPRHDPALAIRAFGLDFPNPLGMAPGFDKGAEVVDPLLRLGFGHVEVGTITPRPQPGNPPPRLFRLPADKGVINRLGFNSEGHAAVHRRLTRRRGAGIVGVNLGANKDSSDRADDYVAGIGAFADIASYFTVNISSPNTPGLRDLQHAAALDDLVARVLDARDRCTSLHGRKPVLVKIAPDLDLAALDDIVRVCRTRHVDGMVVSNTTVTRPSSLRDSTVAKEDGGLSGRPLFSLATQILAAAYLRVERQFPLVGVGGIDGPETALAKIEAGASLLQIYSALVFEGPSLVGAILRGLSERLAAKSYARVADATGVAAEDWAAGKADLASMG
ncbi:MAG TPA: quinone-dependent dihydroorotate dehydrogenase [Beijerinckiaceae bacterium]|nr:quinone-dependent dihydroorotate dehydrogenase [Beijerinckiaceae bacterium]